MEANTAGAQPIQTVSVDCFQCGAAQTVEPGTFSLECSRCDAEVVVPQVVAKRVEHRPLESAPRQTGIATLVAHGVQCPECGGLVGSPKLASVCPFCDSAVVVCPTNQSVAIPDGILPFLLDHKRARVELGRRARKKLGASSAFRLKMRTADVRAIYVPYYFLSVETETTYEGQQGIDQRDSEGKVTGTTWSLRTGISPRPFDHRLVCASRPDDFDPASSMGPWDLLFTQPFDPRMLAGIDCEFATLPAQAAFERIRPELVSDIRRQVRAEIGGDRQRISSSRTSWTDHRYVQVLVPFWVARVKHKGETYRAWVNGRTGRSVIPEVARGKAKLVLGIVVALLLVVALARVLKGLAYFVLFPVFALVFILVKEHGAKGALEVAEDFVEEVVLGDDEDEP